MDSPPEVTVKTTAAADGGGSPVQSSSSPPVQESPFSNFLRNLSPIEPVKAQHISQGFWGLNSPPLAFTSPRINSLREASVQNAGSVHEGKSAYTPQLLPELLQIVQTYEDFEENAGTIVLPGLVDHTRHDNEAYQHQRGFSRRSIQFVEAQPNAIVSCSNSSDQTNDVTSLRSPATPAELEGLDSSHVAVGLNAISGHRQPANFPPLVTPLFPPQPSGRSPLTISKPSSIDSHLVSILNAWPKGGAATVGIKLASAETPPTERKFNSEHADNFEEFKQLSPKNKKYKSSIINSDGCKRCNCKKIQCLKCYCECFAAGFYCVDVCACQECYNRPEYEDTVLDTRKQIVSRNSLAFVPKVVQHVTDIPVNNEDDGNRWMQSSAKHKIGCSCKKSMCLKKYCECYQGKVGCSAGCRCEQCKNSYGPKEEYDGTEYMLGNRGSKERSEGIFDKKLEMVTSAKDLLPAALYDPHPTPLTPSLQYSDHGKDAAKSRFPSRRYVPSPVYYDSTIISTYANTLRSLDYRNEGGMTDQVSSEGDALADLRHLTPLPDFPSMATASSRLQLYPRSDNFKSSSSFPWRGSPVLPITQLTENRNIQELNSDSKVHGIPEYDTPDILTEPPQLGSSSSGALNRSVSSFPPLTPCIDSKEDSTNQNRTDSQENK